MKLHHLLSRDLVFTAEELATLTKLYAEEKYAEFNKKIFSQETKNGEWNLTIWRLEDAVGYMRKDLGHIFNAENALPGETATALAELQNSLADSAKKKINENEFVDAPNWKKFRGQVKRSAASMAHCQEIVAAYNRGARLIVYTREDNPAEGNFIFFQNQREISEEIINCCKLCLEIKAAVNG